MDRNTVKFVLVFAVKTLVSVFIFLLMSIILIVKGICTSLYESWIQNRTLEQEETEKECKFWCLIKSLSRHEPDLALDEKIPSLENDSSSSSNCKNDNNFTVVDSSSPLSPSSSAPRHVIMRKNAPSVSSLLEAANQLESSRKNKRRKDHVVIEKPTTDTMRIPAHIVSSLIGKNGSHIREIENKSHTRIIIESDLNRSFDIDCEGNNVEQKNDFSKQNNTDDLLKADDGNTSISTLDNAQNTTNIAATTVGNNNDYTVCRIKGKLTDISIAQNLIKNYIDENPAPVKVTKEIIIPRNCVGFIIGKHGQNRNYIQNKTKAKFSVQSPKGKATVVVASTILSSASSTSLPTTTTTAPEDDNDEWEDLTFVNNVGKENGHDTVQEPASVIVIKGVQEAVDGAERMIMDIVKAHSGNGSKKKRQRYHSNQHNFDDPNSSSSSSSYATGDTFSMSNSVSSNKFGRLKKPQNHRNHKTQNNNKNSNKDNLQGMTFEEEEDWEPKVNNDNNHNNNTNTGSSSSTKAINNFGTTIGINNENVSNFSNMQPNHIRDITFTHRQEYPPNQLDGGRLNNNTNPYPYYPNGRGRFMRTPQNQQQQKYNQPRFPTSPQGPSTYHQTHYNNNFRHPSPHNSSYPAHLRFDSRQGIIAPNPYKWIANNNNNKTSTQQHQSSSQQSQA